MRAVLGAEVELGVGEGDVEEGAPEGGADVAAGGGVTEGVPADDGVDDGMEVVGADDDRVVVAVDGAVDREEVVLGVGLGVDVGEP